VTPHPGGNRLGSGAKDSMVSTRKHRGEEGATPAPTSDTAQRREFHDRISQQNLTPPWLSLANLATPEPRGPHQPASRRFDVIRSAMAEAGGLITAKEAERRPLRRQPAAGRPQKRRRRETPAKSWKCAYGNPVTSDYAMATMGTSMQLLPKGLSTAAHRSTDATVVVPIEGRKRAHISPDAARESFVAECGRRDIFVAPSWRRVRHKATDDSVMFSFSDRPIQEALRLFRNDRGNV